MHELLPIRCLLEVKFLVGKKLLSPFFVFPFFVFPFFEDRGSFHLKLEDDEGTV